jgi:hypothetical protein
MPEQSFIVMIAVQSPNWPVLPKPESCAQDKGSPTEEGAHAIQKKSRPRPIHPKAIAWPHLRSRFMAQSSKGRNSRADRQKYREMQSNLAACYGILFQESKYATFAISTSILDVKSCLNECECTI